ncbi:MAG: Tetratricopeptide 1 repeat-containing protein, partial [Bryobacterales bacterium]|nr:Tetratricopeptide 1 repeat-containing protein [Bryobacterales bacterium]
HTEESLWLDVTRKSPANGRGLMNYGITQMAKGDYKTALDYLNRSEVLNPDYYVLEINLGVANGAVGNTEKAEKHFARALELADDDVSPRYYYARWLSEQGRYTEALAHLAAAEYQNPDYLFAPQLAMEIHGTRGDATGLRAVAQRTLARFPSDPVAKSWLSKAATLRPQPSSPEQPRPEHLVDASLALYQAHRFDDCIAVAKQALKLRPGYAEAWNNIAAAQLSMKHWDEGIAAAKKALELKPDLKLARDNLAWAEQHRDKP